LLVQLQVLRELNESRVREGASNCRCFVTFVVYLMTQYFRLESV
jgi:hypothetical protein